MKDILNLEQTDLDLYIDEVINHFKYEDIVNYNMYKDSGLDDYDIYLIITSPSIKKLYFKEV